MLNEVIPTLVAFRALLHISNIEVAKAKDAIIEKENLKRKSPRRARKISPEKKEIISPVKVKEEKKGSKSPAKGSKKKKKEPEEEELTPE